MPSTFEWLPDRSRFTVSLCDEDIICATPVGEVRQSEAERLKLVPDWEPRPGERSLMEEHIFGAITEAAFAVGMELPWERTVNTFRTRPDVGAYQVRGVRKDDDFGGMLKIREVEKEKPDAIFVLLRGDGRDYIAIGWIVCADGIANAIFADPGGRGAWAYFVSRYFLHPMSTLPRNHITPTSASA